MDSANARQSPPEPVDPTHRTLGADRPFLLEGDAVWIVESGHVDVFFVRLVDGQVNGRRRGLLRVGTGNALYGVDAGLVAEGHALQAVGTAGASVRVVSWGDFWGAHVSAATEGQRRLLVDWVEHFSRACKLADSPREPRDLAPGARLSVQPQVTLQPRDNLVWVEVEAGALNLWSEPKLALTAGTLFPLAATAWLDANEESVIAVLADTAALDATSARAGLQRLHQAGLQALHIHEDLLKTREETRDHERLRVRRNDMMTSLVDLVATLDPGARQLLNRASNGSRPGDDALLGACRLVAAAVGTDVMVGRVPAAANQRQLLQAMATHSRFRIRRVSLQGDWWRKDCGPLLAFTRESRESVALLQDGPGRYTLHHPLSGERVRVDEVVARSVSPSAYVFYRPLPPTPLAAKELFSFVIRGCRGDFLLIMSLGIATSVLAMFTPVATGVIFNSIIPSSERGHLVQVGVVLIVCALAGSLLQVARGIAVVRLDTRMASSMQAAIWDRLLNLPTQFFRKYSAGDLAVRVNGVEGVRQALSGAAIRALLSGVLSLSNFVLLFHYSPRLTAAALLLTLAALIATVVVAYLQLRHQREIAQLRAKVSGVVLQFLTGIAKIRVAGAEAQAFARWARLFSRQRRAQFRYGVLSNQYAVVYACFSLVSSIVLFGIVGEDLASGGMRVGDFVAFTAAFSTSLGATLSTGFAVLSMLAALPQYELARPILQASPEAVEQRIDPGPISGEISIDHVTFRYQPDGPATLDDVTLRIRPGEFVAFVGPSGSGKSTLLRLLLGFERPEAGAIYYDGQDLQDLDLRIVRRQIGVVLQGGHVTPGDVFSQIVGSTTATLDDAWEAARMAGLDEEIRRMPMGMHTIVSEGGTTFSGGQRQRLMIARAIVGRPRMLFLDEATSALDNHTQARVSESLENLRATRLVIAHRLSTILKADRIYVVSRGKIVQMGTYDELMREPDGHFAELVRRQLS